VVSITKKAYEDATFIPYYNPLTGPYLGRDSHVKKIFLPLKEGEANHIWILGKSGYGKTTFMKGLAEGIWEYYKARGQRVLIIIIERKFDITKYKKLKAFYYREVERLGNEEAKARYDFLSTYLYHAEHGPLKHYLGMPGDFAMGLPAYSFKHIHINSTKYPKDILTWHGLKPKAFSNRRIVFRPTRPLEAVKIDNGPLTEVVEGKIHYKQIDFHTLAKRTHIISGTRYARFIEKYWDIQKIRDPDLLIQTIKNEYRKMGKDPDPPDATLGSIISIMEMIKNDRLFAKAKEKDFTSLITPDKINIIDFSQNSDLSTMEERIIFKLLVDYVTSKYVMSLKIPTYIIIDEIQDLIGTANQATPENPAWLAVEDLYRKGRSMNITLIASTQYMYRLPLNLVIGAAHVAVVGRLASPKDEKILRDMIPDGHKIRATDEYESLEEMMQAKKDRFRGWFSINKDFTLRMYFRPCQSF